MSRTHPVRRYTPWPRRWPMLYGNEEFVSQGTVLDVTATGWRMAGPMPVRPGTRLNFWVWPSKRPDGIHVEGATVLWVKGFEFALEVQGLIQSIASGWRSSWTVRWDGGWSQSQSRSRRPDLTWPCGFSMPPSQILHGEETVSEPLRMELCLPHADDEPSRCTSDLPPIP